MQSIFQRPPVALMAQPGEIHHHASDLTVTFAADVPLSRLQSVLASQNQWLPADGDPNLPISELILSNSSGPIRLGYGAWRDVLLGAQFLNGRDELITVGGRVVKNVAGYDITKFLVGSYGIFGNPVSFTARTWRLPSGAVHVMLANECLAKLSMIIASALKPQWAILTQNGLQFGYVGDNASIEFCRERVADLSPIHVNRVSIEQDILERARLWNARPGLRIAVPPASLLEFINDAGLSTFSADAAFGIVQMDEDASLDLNRIKASIKKHGGSLTRLGANGLPEAIQTDLTTYTILKRLKAAFDPDNQLPPLPPHAA